MSNCRSVSLDRSADLAYVKSKYLGLNSKCTEEVCRFGIYALKMVYPVP